ncbi:MAG: 16S rRNA (guanine(527)-N(7))-methyltransferase RsmG [Thermomicrobiales bacterium]|nr:16S rRNA (guanine(527)-N(7))-methyltransferase RsmG [Thermomicrobiales bacterium]
MTDSLPLLKQWCDEHDLPLDGDTSTRLAAYLDVLLETNQVMNLTRITDPDDAQIKLLADSLDLLRFIPDDAHSVIDIGSGCGVPGMPIAIARPDLFVTLVDATAKKARFLDEAADKLGLTNVEAIQARAEELGRIPKRRERFAVATARAVARLATLAELTLPFVRLGGVAILPKGSAANDELVEATYAIGMLGGKPRGVFASNVEGTRIVVIDKVRATPAQFPRRTGLPNSSPLLSESPVSPGSSTPTGAA